MHLDARGTGIPEHLVAELLRVEVRAQIAVQTSEDIQVEGGGGSGGVIVSGEQSGFGLVLAGYEVGAEEQRVAGQQLRAQVAENLRRVLWREVADAGANVQGQSPGVGQPVERERLAGVIGHLTTHGDAGDVPEDIVTGLCKSSLRDIDW